MTSDNSRSVPPANPGFTNDPSGAQRTFGIFGIVVVVGVTLPLLGLLTPTRVHFGIDEVTLFGACSLVIVAGLVATAAYRRYGPTHPIMRALDLVETVTIQLACQGLVFFSTLEVSPLWFLMMAHVGFVVSAIGTSNLAISMRLILGITALHFLLQLTVRGSLVGAAVTLLVLALTWAVSRLFVEIERRLQAAELAKIEAERSLAEAQLQESRARIARDLHDTVGADLAAIIWSSVAIKDRSEPGSQPALEALGLIASRAVDDMRTAVWALREPARTWVELVAYTKSRCSELAQHGPELVWNEGTAVDLEVSVERAAHVVRAALEAVRNAVQHAKASRITVSLVPLPRLELTVADDGHGFTSSPASDGQGLASLRKRAIALGGELDIRTGPTGTTVTIDAPA